MQGGSNGSRGAEPPELPHFNHCPRHDVDSILILGSKWSKVRGTARFIIWRWGPSISLEWLKTKLPLRWACIRVT